MSKFSKIPGGKDNAHVPTAEDFVAAANVVPVTATSHPWDGEDNTKRRSGFNMRFTDAELKKLKFISENTPFSMHEFCLHAVLPVLEAKIAELTKRKG